LNRFAPHNRHAQQVLETFKVQLTVGIQCARLYDVMSPTLKN
jgi:hypothetical protein